MLPIRHAVTAIGFARIDALPAPGGGERYALADWRAGGEEGGSEGDLVRAFWAHFERLSPSPRLVTFNGRGYGLPLLRYRAMAHGLSARRYFDEKYDQRYAAHLHFDVMDRLCEHGATAWPSLEDARLLLDPSDAPSPDLPDRARAVDDVRAITMIYAAMRRLSGHASPAARAELSEAFRARTG